MDEKKLEHGHSPEAGPKITLPVSQPHKLQTLIETIDLLNKVSERIGESNSGDWSGGSSGTGQGYQGQAQVSARDQAIANIPSPQIMQQELQKHIVGEIKDLRKHARRAARRASRAGNAHQLTQLYARIRRLNSLLQDLFEASVEVLKRLYIRIFIDKQSVL